MRGCGNEIRIIETPKNAKLGVVRGRWNKASKGVRWGRRVAGST